MTPQKSTSIFKTIIAATKGEIFSVTFKKKDGTLRDMVCRTGVTKHIKGTGKPMGEAAKKVCWCVFDMQKREYRTVPIDRIIGIKASGVSAFLPKKLGATS